MKDNGVVVLNPGESIEHALKRLDRIRLRNGVLSAIKRHVEFTPPSLAKRIKSAKARRSAWKREKRRAAFDHEPPGTKRMDRGRP